MGMYTELHFNVELERDAPDSVRAILEHMVRTTDEDVEAPDLPDHLLFKTERWDFMLHCDSYYFPADTHSTFRRDEIGDAWYLCVRTNLKNYGGEIEKFLDWVLPYVDADNECLGYYRYEADAHPTLIYKSGARAVRF